MAILPLSLVTPLTYRIRDSQFSHISTMALLPFTSRNSDTGPPLPAGRVAWLRTPKGPPVAARGRGIRDSRNGWSVSPRSLLGRRVDSVAARCGMHVFRTPDFSGWQGISRRGNCIGWHVGSSGVIVRHTTTTTTTTVSTICPH